MLKLNPGAVTNGKNLINDGKYALNTVWASNVPSDAQRTRASEKQGETTLQQWYLATDEAGVYVLPVGDFNRLHRSAINVAKREAEQNGAAEVVAGADELLDLMDRLNAC